MPLTWPYDLWFSGKQVTSSANVAGHQRRLVLENRPSDYLMSIVNSRRHRGAVAHLRRFSVLLESALSSSCLSLPLSKYRGVVHTPCDVFLSYNRD
jgi:hypothetical protein